MLFYPSHQKNIVCCGKNLKKAKNYEGAVENYSKAIEMDPKLEKAYVASGRVL